MHNNNSFNNKNTEKTYKQKNIYNPTKDGNKSNDKKR